MITFELKNTVITHIKLSAYLSFIFLLSVNTNLQSQNSSTVKKKLDELRLEYLDDSDNDTLKAIDFTMMAKMARYIDQDSAKNLLRQAIAMHKEKRVSDRSHSFAYNVLADIYIKEQKVDSALVIYEEAYTFFSELKNPTYFLKIAPTYGTTLVENNEISLGIEIFNKGIKIALDKNQYADLGYLYAYLGNIMLHQQRDFERANIIFRKGLVACDKMLIESGYNKANDLTTSNYDRIRSTINTGLTELYSKKMQYDSAIYFGEKAVDQALKVEYFQKALIANNLLSKAHLKKKSYESAEYFNNNALSLFSKVKDLNAMAESQIISMSILLSQNRLEECITLGNIILNKDKRVLNSEMKAEIYNKLFEANMILGNKKQIISSKDSFLHYTNQSFDEESASLLAKMYDETLYNEQKSQNTLLLSQQEIAKKQSEIQKLTAIGLIIALFLAIAWAVTSFQLYKQKTKQSITLERIVNRRTRELQEVNEELVQANYELRALSYIASHDLKEPMRNIGSYIFLMQRKLSAEVQSTLEKDFSFIKNNLRRLYNLVEGYTQYINFSKSELLSSEKVDLNFVLEEIRKDLKTKIVLKEYQISHKTLPTIKSNQSAIYFIFKNLIENALKYNKNETPIVHIYLTETADETNIYFKDNGIGITPKFKEKIFDMYKRLHNQSEFSGTGLGLSIVKILTKKMNGTIELESSSSTGSTFKLSLPK